MTLHSTFYTATSIGVTKTWSYLEVSTFFLHSDVTWISNMVMERSDGDVIQVNDREGGCGLVSIVC